MCTPAATNLDLLRACAAKGVKAAFITSAGYGEAGEEGRRRPGRAGAGGRRARAARRRPERPGRRLDAGVDCAPRSWRPYPPPGRIGIASQSGNFVSTFMNYARHYGVGVSRAVSAGNAAAVGVADYLEFYADDPATNVGLAYVEGLVDGRGFFERHAPRSAERMPVVLVKGGATDVGARAAASHTGSLATDDRVFDGACRQAGVVRAATIEEAYEAAATFATQPLPKGPRVAVVTTAGGWGVVTADAIARARGLELLPLPADLQAALDKELPPRWSRNNPIDMAGGETSDTIPTVLELTASHPEVDAVVFLGIGIQGNQGRMERRGPVLPRPRPRADRRLPRAPGPPVHHRRRRAVAIARQADPHRHRAGHRRPATTRPSRGAATPASSATPRPTGPSPPSTHLWRHARWRQRRGLLTARRPASRRVGRRASLRSLGCSSPRARSSLRRPVRPVWASVVGRGRGRRRRDAGRRRRGADHAGALGPAGAWRCSPRPIADRRLGAALDELARRRQPGIDAASTVASAGPAGLRRATPTPPLVPASVEKLVTAVAALEVLGPDHRFRTAVVAGGARRSTASWPATSWLVGGGDPLLATAATPPASGPAADASRRSRTLADALVAGRRHRDRRARSSATSPATTPTATPTPGRTASSTRTSRARCRRLTVNDGWVAFPPNPDTSVPDEAPAADPAAHAAAVLGDAARRAGAIAVGGGRRRARRRPARSSSPRSSRRRSTDVVGRAAARERQPDGRAAPQGAGRRPGPTGHDGRRRGRGRRGRSAELGLPVAGVVVADGSGLAPDNRVSCALAPGDPRPRRARRRPSAAGLAVAGRDRHARRALPRHAGRRAGCGPRPARSTR